VSPGTDYLSATWGARTCTFSTTGKGFERSEIASQATNDIVWSPAGRAFTEILSSEDLIVGRIGASGRPWVEGRITGAHTNLKENDKTQSVSISDSATRVALIDEHKVIRVYSLAEKKVFLSRFERNSLALAPDGRWMAIARQHPRGKTSIDIVPLDLTFAAGIQSRVPVHIDIPAFPTELNATRDAVLAVPRQFFLVRSSQGSPPSAPQAASP
jgi:hypothetical protein